MTFVQALLGGLVGAAIGGGAASLLIGLLSSGMPKGDIGAAVFIVAIFMPIGILGGLAAGAVPVLRSRGIRAGKQIASYLAGVFATLLAVTAAAAGLYIYAVEDFMRDTPLLMFEIRVPDGAPLPVNDRILLRTDKNTMPGEFKPLQSVRKEGNAWVFAGNVEMYFRTSNRQLEFTLENKTKLTYRIDLSRTPSHSKTFGPWHRPKFIAEPGKSPVRAGPQDGYEIRHRAAFNGQD